MKKEGERFEELALDKTEQPEEFFDEQEFIKNASLVFFGLANNREALLEALIEEPIGEVKEKELEEADNKRERLDLENIGQSIRELKQFSKGRWPYENLHPMTAAMEKALLDEGGKDIENFKKGLADIETEVDTEWINETLKKHYHARTGPLGECYDRDSVQRMRIVAIWLEKVASKDPLLIVEQTLVKEMAKAYLYAGKKAPPKLRIKLGTELLRSLEEKVASDLGEKERRNIEKTGEAVLKEEQQKLEEDLRKMGTHERFIEARKRQMREGWERHLKGLVAFAYDLERFAREDLKLLDKYLETTDDPAEFAALLLGVKKEQ